MGTFLRTILKEGLVCAKQQGVKYNGMWHMCINPKKVIILVRYTLKMTLLTYITTLGWHLQYC